jgi:hypothetical protein
VDLVWAIYVSSALEDVRALKRNNMQEKAELSHQALHERNFLDDDFMLNMASARALQDVQQNDQVRKLVNRLAHLRIDKCVSVKAFIDTFFPHALPRERERIGTYARVAMYMRRLLTTLHEVPVRVETGGLKPRGERRHALSSHTNDDTQKPLAAGRSRSSLVSTPSSRPKTSTPSLPSDAVNANIEHHQNQALAEKLGTFLAHKKHEEQKRKEEQR